MADEAKSESLLAGLLIRPVEAADDSERAYVVGFPASGVFLVEGASGGGYSRRSSRQPG